VHSAYFTFIKNLFGYLMRENEDMAMREISTA
jgi:hypothetical protein